MKTTLLAVTGLSPAIVTETLWSLAKQKPSIIPDRVIFITTSIGAAKLEEQFFAPRPSWNGLSVWDALRKALKAPVDKLIADRSAVISMADPKSGRTLQLDDIRTPEQNAAAAEFIFSQVWDVVRDKNQRLVASVAGGRKTMGALLHSAVSLIGRQSDLITHILIDPPFDSLEGFFFPSQPGGAVLDRNGKPHNPKFAKPLLAEVPFVSLRNRFEELDELPNSFFSLRDSMSECLAVDANRVIPLRIEPENRRFFVDGKEYKATPPKLALLEFILHAHLRGETFTSTPLATQDAAAEAFVSWRIDNVGRFPGLRTSGAFTAKRLCQDLHVIRHLLDGAAWKPALASFVQRPFRLEVRD